MTQPLSDAFASNVRAEVARQQLSQQQLAELTGVTQSTISRRLRGLAPFDLEQAERIAQALHVDVATLLRMSA